MYSIYIHFSLTARNGFGITLGKNNTTGFYRVTGIFYRYFDFVRVSFKIEKAVKLLTARQRGLYQQKRQVQSYDTTLFAKMQR